MFTDYLSLKTIEIPPGQEWRAGQKGGLLFLFLRTGSCKWSIGASSQSLQPGEVLVAANVSNGVILAQGDAPASAYVFCVQFEHMVPLLEGEDFEAMQREFVVAKPGKWFRSSDPVAIETHELMKQAASQSPLNRRVQLLQVAVLVLGKEFEGAGYARQPQKPMERNLLRVLGRLSLDELVTLSVDEIAARCNCSPRHLNYLFNQYFRSSVGALRMKIRLLKAVWLLQTSKRRVIDIAQECGFNHLGLFQTCFRRHFGVSPCQWRKMMASSAGKRSESAKNGGNCPEFGTENCPLAIEGERGCGSIMTLLADQYAAVQQAGGDGKL